MAYRMLPHMPLLLVTVPEADGGYRVDYHYFGGGSALDKGPIIPWLGEPQREMFLTQGFVEEIDDDPAPLLEAHVETAMSAVDSCVAALQELNVPTDAGAPACRTALREAGYRFGNDVVAQVVRSRKQLSRTVNS